MGLNAIVSTIISATTSASSASSAVGTRGDDDPEIRLTLITTIIPLLVMFGGIVLFKSLQII